GGTNVSQSGGNLGIDLERIAGAAVTVAGSGVQRVGMAGYSNTAVDSANTTAFGGNTSSSFVVGATFNMTGGPTTTSNSFPSSSLMVDSNGNLRQMPALAPLHDLTTWSSSAGINSTQTLAWNNAAGSPAVGPTGAAATLV